MLGYLFGAIFVLLGFGFIITDSFISGLFMLLAGLILIPKVNKIIKNKFNKKLSVKVRVILAVVFVIISFVMLDTGETTQVEEKQITDEIEKTPELIKKEQIEEDITKILGSDELIDLTYFDGTRQVIIKYKASDYSGERTLQYDHIKIYEKLFDNYDLEEVAIFSWMTFFDQYGQEVERVAVRSIIIKSTADKINWGNFITTNLPNIAEDYYVHPVLK